jgi:hypothetical protein
MKQDLASISRCTLGESSNKQRGGMYKLFLTTDVLGSNADAEPCVIDAYCPSYSWDGYQL